MTTFPLTNRIDVHVDPHVYTTHTHGPKVWPWWKLVVIRVCPWRNNNDVTIPIKGCNVWIYTRWCARCIDVWWPRVPS